MKTSPREIPETLLGDPQLLLEQYPEEGLALLYEKYLDPIKAIAIRMLQDPTEAEDIAHEIFLNLPKKISQFSLERGTLVAWISWMTRNRCFDFLRRKKSRPEESYNEIEGQERSADDIGSEETLLLKELQEQISSFLQTLDPDQRIVLKLAYYEELSHTQISELLGIPVGTVKSRIHYAKKHLKALLAKKRKSVLAGNNCFE